MQLVDSLDSSVYASNGLQDFSLGLLWPSDSADDVVRRALAYLLLEDPDHRLRVVHLESLLQTQLPAHTGYTSGLGLQTLLLKDDPTAAIFHVDFTNTRVTDWRSRVVYLDVSQLSKELAAARQRNGVNTTRVQGANHRNQQQQHAAAASIPKQQQPDPLSTSLGALGPSTLDQIWGASPVFGAPGSLAHGAFSEPLVPRTSATGGTARAAAGSSSSGGMPIAAAAGGGGAGSVVGSAGAKEPRVSLFGSSFEVPHAIASCWAAPSSCGSAGESVMHKNATTTTRPNNNSSSSRDIKVSTAAAQQARSSACGILDQLNGHGSEGGSSTPHNIKGAAAAAASRLRRQISAAPSSNVESVGHAGSSSVAGSVGAMSGCLDISTPKSIAAAGDAATAAVVSPVDSSAGEDDAEYNEAQLLFGLPGVAAPTAAAAAAGGTALVNGNSGISSRAAAAPAPAGDMDAGILDCGVDWSRIAAMHHGQQQHSTAAQFNSHSVPNSRQPRLSGVDDVVMTDTAVTGQSAPGQAAAAAATAAMMQQQQRMAAAAAAPGMYGAEFLAAAAVAAAANMGRRSFGGDQATSGGYFGDAAAAGNGLFNANATGSSATAATSLHGTPGNGAFPVVYNAGAGAAATAAQLAESVLHDLECPSSGQQLQQVSTPHLHSSSYSSAVMSDRSSSGHWGASPAAMHAGYHMMQQQQQQRRQQQQLSENAGDVSLSIDRVKQTSNGGAASAAAIQPVKQAGSFAAVAAAAADKEARSSAAATEAPAGAAAAPRLTGWASVAARDPRPLPTSAPSPNATPSGSAGSATGRDAGSTTTAAAAAAANAVRQQQQSGVSVKAAAGAAVSRLAPAVRTEVQALVAQFTGVLKLDDFDDGVVHQLNAKRSEEEAVAAVRHIAHYDLANIQHMAAYLNHLIKHYNHGAAAAAAAAAAEGSSVATGSGSGSTRLQGLSGNGSATNGSPGLVITQSGGSLGSTLGGPGNRNGSNGGGGAAAGSNLGAFGGQIRLASVPVSTKAMLQKLPLKVFKQLEQLVAGCAYLEWRHFDAGVVKVLAQLSKLCESDVFEELELLAATDLSNVEYMPAYLNKRLNNKLWSRRKADGHAGNMNGNNN